MKFVVFGLTISSSWHNRHAGLWRGLLRALSQRGHKVVFYERELAVFSQQQDSIEPFGLDLQKFSTWEKIKFRVRRDLDDADVAIVSSGCPVADEALALIRETAVPIAVFYDLDSAATLDYEEAALPVGYEPPESLSGYDLVLTTTGGKALDELRTMLGAKRVAALFSAADASVADEQVARHVSSFRPALSYLFDPIAGDSGTVERLFIQPAGELKTLPFSIGGPVLPVGMLLGENVTFTRVENAAERVRFYLGSRLLLEVAGRANRKIGHCPSQRLFQAAAMRTAIVTDRWEGLSLFFEPDREILVADTAHHVIAAVELPDAELAQIGRRARERVLDQHTYAHRAMHLETLIENAANASDEDQLSQIRGSILREDAPVEG
jgi:spore maturation protein CgeB